MRPCPQKTIYSYVTAVKRSVLSRRTYNNAITSGFEIKWERVTEKKEPFTRYAYTPADGNGMKRMEFEKRNPG